MPNVTAIVPARGGSKGVPRKNVRPFLGKPLLAHTVGQALAARLIDNVFICSEDDEILAAGVAAGARPLRRPGDMATDSAEVDPMLVWSIAPMEEQVGSIDVLVLLYPTAPLRGVDVIDTTVGLVRDGGYDSALTLVADHSFLWRVDGDVASPTNYEPARRVARQKTAWNQWIENKAVYAMKRDLLVHTGCRLGGRIGHVPMDPLRSIDIDRPEDFVLAEAVASTLPEFQEARGPPTRTFFAPALLQTSLFLQGRVPFGTRVNSHPSSNRQLVTRWADGPGSRLVTRIQSAPLRALEGGEILVRMLAVPLHGSFWLASHPAGLHPRRDEFLRDGHFVFGNGGTGLVVAVGPQARGVREGDFVAILGHIPCDHYDCYACNVLHRYTECDYNQGRILGHGKGAPDGSYGEHCILPPMSYELCYRREESPTPEQVLPFMYAFLVADMRNALTRHPDTLRNRRMLLFGAGNSALIAAYIHLHSCPEARIFAVDPSPERLAQLCALNPEAIQGYPLDPALATELNRQRHASDYRQNLRETIDDIREGAHTHFGGRSCNLLLDASSGNSAPLWDNAQLLAPSAHVIAFGFGSEHILLGKELIQLSGLNLLMTRGVGNIRNRRETIELIKAGASRFITDFLAADAIRLEGLDSAEAFIREQHEPAKDLFEIPRAYIQPSSL